METASSPGQIFLFGEHAVVYGQPALATAINARTEVKAERLSDGNFKVESRGIGKLNGEIKNVNGKWTIQERSGDSEKLRFVTKVTELTLNRLDSGGGLKLHIISDLPPGSGLGSSSAVSTATSAAVSSALDSPLEKDEISQLAFDAEVEVQGAASRTGVNVATYGGFLEIQGDKSKKLEDLPELNVLIGYTDKYGDTGEMIEKVRRLKESFPEIIDLIMETIGKTTKVGIKSLQRNHVRKVGALMDANQNLLEGLGVSSSELRNLIRASRSAGTIGAKLTGSGGGGCMIALCPKKVNKIAKAIEDAGGEPIVAKIGVEGLKY